MKTFAKNHPYLTLLFLSLFLYLIGNSYLPITDTAESNYALTAKEMVLSGDWISPQIYGKYWYDKPIFYYWELALSYSLFGFTEFASRLPSAIMGAVNVLFTFRFTRRVFSTKAAWMAAIILGCSVEFFALSKAVITDATLFFFMSGAIAFFYLGYIESKKYYFLCYVFAALAVLTKGPIGLLLPGCGAFLFLLYRRDLRELLHVHLLSGTILFLVIAGSWYGLMCHLHGSDFILNFIGVHNVLRATVAEHPSHNKWYFYLMVYLVGFFPWSLALPISLFKKWRHHTLSLRRSHPACQLLFLYGLTVLVFFQLVQTKYTTYTFPALFSLAILTALLYEDVSLRIVRTSATMAAVFCCATLLVAPGIMLQRSGKEIGLTLAHMDTTGKIICYDEYYRTSTVFYSGKTIFRAEPGDKIADMEPGGLSWNAKNVMPFIPLEDVVGNPNAIVIKENKDDHIFALNSGDHIS